MEGWITRTPVQSWCERTSGLPGRWPWAADSSARPGPGPEGGTTGTPVRRHGYNYNLSRCTQGAWRIPAETICSFQAAILQTHSAFLSGDGVDRGNKESRCSSSLTLWFAANE